MVNQNEKSRIEQEVTNIKGIIAPIMGNWPELFSTASWLEIIGERTVFIDVTHEAQANEEKNKEKYEEIKTTLATAIQRIINTLAGLGYSVTGGDNVMGYISNNRASFQIRCSLTAIKKQQEVNITTTPEKSDIHGVGTTVLDLK